MTTKEQQDPKIVMTQLSASDYQSANGLKLQRTPRGIWVLRDAAGVELDRDQYRNDIAERRDIDLRGGLI